MDGTVFMRGNTERPSVVGVDISHKITRGSQRKKHIFHRLNINAVL